MDSAVYKTVKLANGQNIGTSNNRQPHHKSAMLKLTQDVFSVVGEGFPSVLQSSSSGEHLHSFQISSNTNNRVDSVDTGLCALTALLQRLEGRVVSRANLSDL